jgi:hypothetical protein
LGKNVTEHRLCFDFLYKFCLKYFLFQEKMKEVLLKIFIGLRVKYLSIVSDFNDIWIFTTDFRKMLKYKFRENPSSDPRRKADGRTDTTKLIVALHNFHERA